MQLQECQLFPYSFQDPTVCTAERGKISQPGLKSEVLSENKFIIYGEIVKKSHRLTYL